MGFWITAFIIVVIFAIGVYIGYRIGCVQNEPFEDEDEIL